MRETAPDLAALLRERARRLAQPELAEGAIGTEAVTVFAIGGQCFGLPLADVAYAARLQHLTPIPRGERHYLGLTWVGGYLVTVLDVATLLGLREVGLRDVTSCVVASRGSRQLGFGAEVLLGIEEVPASRIAPLPAADSQTAGACRVAFVGADRVLLLDLGQLLARLDLGGAAGA